MGLYVSLYRAPFICPFLCFFLCALVYMSKEGSKKAEPVLLEPIMKVEVTTPENYMGDVVSDLNRRRGIIQNISDSVSGKTIKSEIPLSEMFGYATSLRSQTQ